MIRIAYATVIVGLAALWIALLAGPVLSARPETDLWWMRPLMEAAVQGRSGWALFAFLFSPAPFLLGQPLLKLHLWLNTSSVGLSIPALLALSMAIHALNAVGVYGLSRRLGFSGRVGAIAGVVYLTMFAHFHAYLWPTAVQHLIAVGTILLLLNLYLSAEQRIREGKNPRALIMATLAIMALASLQRSALLGPLLMLVHTLWGSDSSGQRKDSFGRWLPGWILCGIYPSFALAAVGDPRLTRLFSQWPLFMPVKALLLWGAGVGLLFLIRRVELARFRRLALLGLVGGVVLWALRDKRQWLFLYNAAVPFSSILTSFLEPLRTALLIPSTEPYHIIPPQVSAWTLATAAALILAFAGVAPERRKTFLLFGVWYGVGLLYFLQPYSSCPVRIPSRYFIYLSPMLAIMFSSVLCGAGDRLARRTRVRPVVREAAVLALVAALCIPNLVAIRLEMFRGRLANTYLLYGDLRRPETEDPFDSSLREAQQAWDRGDLREAERRFREAVEVRPFLLRYTLSPYRLEDARWLTGGMDFRQWASKTGGLYRSWGSELPEWAPRFQETDARIHRELSDYLYCLLALSYLEYQNGNGAESERWRSRMGLLEQDGWRLSRWIREDARVKSNSGLQEFARRLDDPMFFPDPLPWRKDDYGFGLFMTRFLTQWTGGISWHIQA